MKKQAFPPLTHKKQRSSAKRVLLSIGVILLLLIPTYLAAATYIIKKNTPVVDIHTTYESMSLIGPMAQEQSASAKKNATLFSIFTTLCQDGEKMVAIPPRYNEGRYVATMSSADKTDVYEFYFSREETTCFYINPEGEIFRTNHELIPEFLNDIYAFELYAASTLPVLTTAATDEVMAHAVSWSYRTANGTFVERKLEFSEAPNNIYPIANDISFYFSLLPSSHEISIRRNGILLYSGTSDGISLPLQDGEILDFEIRATFSPSSEQDYYGEIVYRFKMQVVEAAHFTPNKTQLTEGDILLVRCENVKNVEKLLVTATPALEAEPIIFRRGDYVYASIPVTSAGAKRLQITYGTVTAAFDITVASHLSHTHTLSDSTLHGDWEALLSTTIPALTRQLGATSDSGLSPRVITALPDEQIFGYGDFLQVGDVQVGNSPLPFHLYRASGTVRALAAGQVCYVGNDPTLGYFVVVDHGCGLYTWFAGLSEARTVVGDILAVGDTVGLASTALYHEESVLIMATLGKSVISLEQLCDASAIISK